MPRVINPTIKEHIASFPHPYDLEAAINCPWTYVLKQRVASHAEALMMAFNWSGTEQGYSYWFDFYRTLANIPTP